MGSFNVDAKMEIYEMYFSRRQRQHETEVRFRLPQGKGESECVKVQFEWKSIMIMGFPRLGIQVLNHTGQVLIIRSTVDMYCPARGWRACFDYPWMSCSGQDCDGRYMYYPLPRQGDSSREGEESNYHFQDDPVNLDGLLEVISVPHLNGAQHDLHFDNYTYAPHGCQETLDFSNSFSATLESALCFRLLCDFELVSSQDLTQRFPCHRVVLASRSPVFNKMLSPRWSEYLEGSTIVGGSPNSVCLFLRLIYGHKPENSPSISSNDIFEVLELLDKYIVQFDYFWVISEILTKRYDDNSRTAINYSERTCQLSSFDYLLEVWAAKIALNSRFQSGPRLSSFSGLWFKSLILAGGSERKILRSSQDKF